MNLVFISPNFPDNFRNFCDRLHRNGVNVLGIGDAPYDSLHDDLKNSLTEYYKVDNMEDYGQVYRAVAYFAFRHGRIDWIESNNEHWLELDAELRRDFNVGTGVHPDELALWKSKAAMKPVYKAAGIPSARQHRVSDVEAAKAFIEEIGGYPVFAKPTVGVGARMTMCRRVPDVFSEAMGNQLYMALLDTEDEVREYVRFILDEQAEPVIPGLYR